MKLIDRAKHLANAFQWLKPVAMVLAGLAVAAFAYVVFSKTGIAADDQYMLPSVMLMVWSILLAAFLYTFPSVPAPPNPEQGFFARLKTRMKRCYYFILLLLCMATTLAIVLMSFRALRVWLKHFG